MSRKKTSLPAGVELLADGRYKVRVSPLHPITRKRIDREKIMPAETSLAQAIEAREALRAEVIGEATAPTRPPKLDVFAERWLKRQATRLRRTSAEVYATRIAHHLLPYLGHLHMDELERRHLIWWRDELQKKIGGQAGLRTVQGWWADGLRMVRDGLAEFGLVDVTQRIYPPTGNTERRRIYRTLSVEEVNSLLESCDGRYASLVRFLARTGVRLGEGRGLRWSDIDAERGVAFIRQSIAVVDGGRDFQFSAPKSGKPRMVGLTQDLLEALRLHRVAYPGVGDALVWPSGAGTPARTPVVHQTLDRAVARAGIETRVTPQVLRATFNSLALEAGVDRVLLQGMIGHTSDTMTHYYNNMRPATAQAVATAVWEPHVGVRVHTSTPTPHSSTSAGEE